MAYRVLVVDDEDEALAAIKRAMRKEPFEFFWARSAQQALEILGQERVDVVISDEQMPGMAGTEFLALVRERFPETIRFLLSGHVDSQVALRAITDGWVLRVFQKPCYAHELSRAIHRALVLRAVADDAERRTIMPAWLQNELLDDLEGRGRSPEETARRVRELLEEASASGELEPVLDQLEEALERVEARGEMPQSLALQIWRMIRKSRQRLST
ncbi:MAG: response regulator [Deltaproteobacteria bacterium]|nr:response regulator [Deltaproteobacteria bacterium]